MDGNQVLDMWFPRLDDESAVVVMEAAQSGRFTSLAQLAEARAQGLAVRAKTVRVSSLPDSLQAMPAQYSRLRNR